MPKTIMLAGAPGRRAWDESDLTVNEFLPAFKSVLNEPSAYAGLDPDSLSRDSTEPDASRPLPVWRSVSMKQTHLSTGYSQRDWQATAGVGQLVNATNLDAQAGLSFLTSTCITSAHESEAEVSLFSSAELSQHLEQSFALHEEAPSSQISPGAKTPLLGVFSVSDNKIRHSRDRADKSKGPDALPKATSRLGVHIPGSAATTGLNPQTPLDSNYHGLAPLTLPYLADLASLPSAAALIELEPQTVTVDLVVGVISVSPPRSVTIRRTGRDIELIEVLVGDETRAGFCITFWLATGDDSGLRAAVEALRPGDIVALRNTALSHFRRIVHGQSLGGQKARRGVETSVVRLGSWGPKDFSAGQNGQVLAAKFEKVKSWTRDFVRPVTGVHGSARVQKRKRLQLDEDFLPPDETQ